MLEKAASDCPLIMASKEAAKPDTLTFSTSSQVNPANESCAATFQFNAGAPCTQDTLFPFISAIVLTFASLAVARDKPNDPIFVIKTRIG